MDDFVIPGKGRKKGGVRQVVDVAGASAPIVKLGPGDLVIVGDTGLRFLAPGSYIILPLERWAATLGRAIDNEQRKLEDESRQVRRAQHRELIRDRTN